MNRYKFGGPSKATPTTVCQKCLKKGMKIRFVFLLCKTLTMLQDISATNARHHDKKDHIRPARLVRSNC